jgi:hypothetical protein
MPSTTSPIKDPWDVEHARFLQLHPNAIAHSDKFYTGVVHKGFDADATAEELIRRYPVFEEAEQHRKFLVRSLSERHILKGEMDGYFSPRQLWEEDDRVSGKKRFSDEDGLSDDGGEEDDEVHTSSAHVEIAQESVAPKVIPRGVIGEDQLESDEQLAQLLSDPVLLERLGSEGSQKGTISRSPKDLAMTDKDLARLFGEGPEQPTIVATTSGSKVASPINNHSLVEPANDSDLPITLQTADHSTTVTSDSAFVQRILHSLDLSHELPLTSITRTSVDGTLVLALLGHVKINESTVDGSSVAGDPKNPITISNSAAGNTSVSEQQMSTEEVTAANEWNIVTQRPHRPTVAFLFGSQTCSALIDEICWKPESIVATSTAYDHGRILVLLVGEQYEQQPGSYTTHNGTFDPAEQFLKFFDAMQNNRNIPAEHLELAGLLRIAHKDMVDAGVLDAQSFNDDVADSSDDDAEVVLANRGKLRTSEHIQALKKSTMKLEKKLARAREAAEYTTTRSVSCEKERTQLILQRPEPDYVNFSHVDNQPLYNIGAQNKENEAPIALRSSATQAPAKQVSGFPASFGRSWSDRATVSPPTTHNSPTKKRKRMVTKDDDTSAEDSDGGNDTPIYNFYADSDPSVPQRRRKIAKTKDTTRANVEGKANSKRKTKAETKAPTTVVKRKQKPAHKATSAAESAKAISEVRAKLAKFKVPGSSAGGSRTSSPTDVHAGDTAKDREMDGGEGPVGKESDGEESEEE